MHALCKGTDVENPSELACCVPVQLRFRGREPASIGDFRLRPARRVPRIFFDYLDGGTGDEHGIAANRQAFEFDKLGAAIFGKTDWG